MHCAPEHLAKLAQTPCHRCSSSCQICSPILTSMAPKGVKKLSADEQIAKLQQRALQLQAKSSMDWIAKVLKDRCDLVPSVVQHIKALIAHPHGGSIMGEHGDACLPTKDALELSPGSTGTGDTSELPLGASALSSSASDAQSVVSQPTDDDDLLDAIPRKYQNWAQVPPGYILALLSAMEPVALGKQALKVYIMKGKKTMKREAIDYLFEFTTGVTPQTSIPPKLRNMAGLKAHFKALNEKRGRPARDVVLPVAWASDGIYHLEAIDGEVWVKRNSKFISPTHSSFNVKLELQGFNLDSEHKDSIDKLYIDMNWSEHHAMVCHPDSPHMVRVSTLGKKAGKRQLPGAEGSDGDAEAEETPAKKPKEKGAAAEAWATSPAGSQTPAGGQTLAGDDDDGEGGDKDVVDEAELAELPGPGDLPAEPAAVVAGE